MADTASSGVTRKRVGLNPPQHGGWAFVGLPVAVGWTVAGLTLGTFFAGVAFILSFPALYFIGAWLRYPNRERFVRPLTIWLSPMIIAGVLAIATAPKLLFWAPPYIVLGLVSLVAARRKRDRELLNEVFQVVQCSMIVPTLATATGRLADQATALTTIWVAMALVGSILTVRALIRKKNDTRFRNISRTVAALSLPIAVVLGTTAGFATALVAGVAFSFAAWRAFKVQPDSLKPGQLGMIELVFFILIWVTALFAALAS